jgi:hypothetical protein
MMNNQDERKIKKRHKKEHFFSPSVLPAIDWVAACSISFEYGIKPSRM